MDNLDSAIDRAEREDDSGQEENAWQKIARKQKVSGMSRLDYLVYNPERLACTEQEKEACLETVRKLVRLCFEIRRNGVLVAGTLAEKEPDPFFRACLREFEFEDGYIETEDMPAKLDQVLAAYLAAGDYRGGAFLNAVLAAKGMVLVCKHLYENPTLQGELLCVELRGFFGAEYRERVITAIKRETRAHAQHRETSVVPAFDELAQLSLDQRRQLLQNVEHYTLLYAMWGAGAAVEDALLEAMDEEQRQRVELDWDYCPRHELPLLGRDVKRAQAEILAMRGTL